MITRTYAIGPYAPGVPTVEITTRASHTSGWINLSHNQASNQVDSVPCQMTMASSATGALHTQKSEWDTDLVDSVLCKMCGKIVIFTFVNLTMETR